METFTKQELEVIRFALVTEWVHWFNKAKEEGITSETRKIRYDMAENAWRLLEKVRDLSENK